MYLLWMVYMYIIQSIFFVKRRSAAAWHNSFRDGLAKGEEIDAWKQNQMRKLRCGNCQEQRKMPAL